MRHERFRAPSRPGRDGEISDRALAVASYVALGLCVLCLAFGLIRMRAHIVWEPDAPAHASALSTLASRTDLPSEFNRNAARSVPWLSSPRYRDRVAGLWS
jgi:hypothetical protein